MKTLTALSADTALPTTLPITQAIWTLIGNAAESPQRNTYEDIPQRSIASQELPDHPVSITTWKYRGFKLPTTLSNPANSNGPRSSVSIPRSVPQAAIAKSAKPWGLWVLSGMVALCLSGCACPECCGAHKTGTHQAHQHGDKGMDDGTDKGKYGAQKLHHKGSARVEPSHETTAPPRTSPSAAPYFRPGYR